MALSKDPRKRSQQLANLRKGPPAEKGNRRAVTHGGFAQVARARLDAKVGQLFDVLAADAPVRGPDGELPRYDAPLVLLLARVLCRLEDVQRFIADYGWRDAKTKEPRKAVEVEAQLRREAADYLDALGMTPRSRARLGLDLARTADLATAMSEPDPRRKRQLMRQAGLDLEDE